MLGKSKESDSYSISLLNDEEDMNNSYYYYDSWFSKSKSKSNRNWDWDGDHERHVHCSGPIFGSVEIKKAEDEQVMPDGEAELGSAAICRICLEHDGDAGDELIAPCECKGSSQFVHRSCLDHWRSVKEGFAFAHCSTCKAQFHLRINFLEGSCWRNVKFRMFVARDVIFVFFAVQMMISMLGGLTYLCDLHGRFREYIGHGWGHIFSMHPLLFYYCFGALLFFALLGIFGLLMQCTSCGWNNSDTYSRSSSAEGQSVYYFNAPLCINCPDSGSGSGSGSGSDSGEAVIIVMLVLVIIFAIIGIFYGIFAATIGFQRIFQRHYHILTKRELTMEYVVEDLHGHYTPPKLDQEHEERLRILKLL